VWLFFQLELHEDGRGHERVFDTHTPYLKVFAVPFHMAEPIPQHIRVVRDIRDVEFFDAAPHVDRRSGVGQEIALASRPVPGRTVVVVGKDFDGWRRCFKKPSVHERVSHEEFARRFIEHSALGSAHTLRGVQASRPSLFDLEARLREIAVPMLLVTGDEDEPCTDANIFMKRTIPSAGLFVVPRTGHTINLEEPDLFNSACQAFFSSVERGRWSVRGAAAMSPAQIMSAGKTE